MDKVIVVVEAQAAPRPEQSPLLVLFATLPASMPAARQQSLRAEALDIVRARVKPAEQALATFFRTRYLPAARTTIGVQPAGWPRPLRGAAGVHAGRA